MASNTYIQFDGITSEGNSGAIPILSFSQNTPPSQSLTLTKYAEPTIDNLIKTVWSGKQIATAAITCYRSDGSSGGDPVLYLTIEMTQVVISGFSAGGPVTPVDTITLDYGTITYNYAQ